MVARDRYLMRLVKAMWDGEVKIITGLRRSGKSVLLFDLFADYLKRKGVDENHIIRLALDQRKYYQYRNPIALCEFVEGIVSKHADEKFFLFIDEVQFTVPVVDSEHGGITVTIYDMLNELKAYKNLDVYVTGSNSKMLSKDIATEFRGRATQIHIYPLSFAEFYTAHGGDARAALDEYMLFGGMPRLLAIDDERDKKDYLTNLYRELYLKDIVEHNHLEREDLLGVILDFVASQIGSLTNPTNIANSLSSSLREKLCNKTVSSYLTAARDAFLIDVTKRYDVKGKHYFDYPNKYYYTDIGLRNARLNYRQYEPGHIMENIIYNELRCRGFSVDVGVVESRKKNERIQREIDFVVNHGDRRVYIQSAYQMMNAEKVDSELSSLVLTKDFFAKYVIRMDIPHRFQDDNGIIHCPLIDFLLSDGLDV